MTDLWAAFVCTHTANRMYEVHIKARHNLCGESLNTIQKREGGGGVPMTTIMTAVFTTCAQDWHHIQNQGKNILTYTYTLQASNSDCRPMAYAEK